MEGWREKARETERVDESTGFINLGPCKHMQFLKWKVFISFYMNLAEEKKICNGNCKHSWIKRTISDKKKILFF